MAKYQREFLVPYLRDVSALHLALHKLQKRLTALDHQKCSLEKGIHRGEYPLQPRYEASNGVFSMGLGGYLFMFSVSMFVFGFILLGCFCILFGIMAVMIGLIRYVKVTRENSQKEERYNRKLAAYQQLQRKNDSERKAIPAIVDEMRECQAEIERVQDALRSVYCADVIPEDYRNMHTALFLYIWFEAGKSNNLDMTANLLLDDQIKKKLDLFIANKSEMILKQYLQFSKKHQTPEMQKKHTAKIEDKLRQINVTDEERDTYLAMTKSYNATTAYFATAEYIGRI